MALPLISESRALKHDALFQLQRVVTQGGDRFLVKFAVSELRGLEDALLEREFELFQRLSCEHVLSPIRLDTGGDKPSAFYRDIDGVALTLGSAGTSTRLTTLADVARDLCAVLGVFHARGLIVAGMCPRSFVRDVRNQRVVLADAPFACAPERLAAAREEAWLRSPYLPYDAPEVIGRTPQLATPAADQYSLGAVLYELLVDQPPFVAADPAELIQCHLAKQPRPLRLLDHSVPEAVSALIARLLAKNPDDRFESLAAFEDELLRALGNIPRSELRLRARDSARPPVLQLSAELIGVDAARRSLREKLGRTRAAAAVVFVEGDAGVGKTSLLLEVRSLLSHGHYCRGRFEPAGPVAPLSGWAAVLRELAQVLSNRNAAGAAQLRDKLLAALGDGAPLIGMLVPEWAAILGEPTATDAVTGDSGLNRLAVAIAALLRTCAEPDAPLVLVLDDLQWADTSSLRILELVLELPGPLNLLVLAGVRTNVETGGSSAELEALYARLAGGRVEHERLALRPWQADEVREFVSDSFSDCLVDMEGFASFLLARTHGNPLFVHELVRSLVKQRLLLFDDAAASWTWEPSAFRGLQAAESLVEFLTRKVLDLAPELNVTLRVAAALGSSFELGDYAAVTACPPELASAALEPLVLEGFVRVLGHAPPSAAAADPGAASYEFVHDRVLEACRALSTEAERSALSLQIARRLANAHGGPHAEQLAHKVAGYFAAASALITDARERMQCAELCLRAGLSTQQRGAFSQAFDHFAAGLEFLRAQSPDSPALTYEQCLRDYPELARALLEECAEAALLTGRFETMYALSSELLAATRSPLMKVRAYELRIGGFSAQKRFPDAVAAACEVLAELGVRFPRRPGMLHAALGYLLTRRRLFARPTERLVALPANQDPRIKAVSRIMKAMYSAAYLGHRNLFPLLVCRHIEESLAHGTEDFSCVMFVGFAIVLAAMGEHEDAERLGQVSLELLARPGAERHRAQVMMGVYGFVHPWRNHLRDAVPRYTEAVQHALEHGNFEYASHLLTLHSVGRLHSGAPLAELGAEFGEHLAKVGSLRQERGIILQQLLLQLVSDLRADEPSNAPLRGSHYDEREMLPRCLEPLDHNLAFHHHLARMMVNLFLGDRPAALEAAQSARPFYESGAFGIYLSAVFTFWEALLWLWSARRVKAGRGAALRKAARASARLRRWAATGPMNFEHKHQLVEAERCRARGLPDRAAQHYERSIELSQVHGYVHDVALAQEWAAEFYLERGMERLGRQYLRECYATYRRWGATAVTRRLERAYPQHFSVLIAGSSDRDSQPLARFTEALDYRVLLKSSQAISGEVRLSSLLESLLRALSEHAGAQRALLVLEREGQLYVEAEADVDRGGVELFAHELAEHSARLCQPVVRYVALTATPIVLAHAVEDPRFSADPYVQRLRPVSVLCAPIVYQGRLLGVVYLENNRVSHVFTEARLEVASLLAGQAAISITSARFHSLQLEAQQARINPHFLFNALSSLAELALQDGRKTEEAIVKLAQLYRYVLANSLVETVTLDQELEMVSSYLALEKLRLGAKLEFSVSCEEGVKDARIPGLLIQPLVENCIRHAIAPKLTPGSVWVHASRVANQCLIAVQDDGDGVNHGTSGTGFGLRSVQDRLALLYGRNYGLAITSRGGYRIEITIPLVLPSETALR